MQPRIEIRRNSQDQPWSYAELDARQRIVADECRAGGAGALLLSEVAPVITVGKRTCDSDFLLSESALSSRGISVYPTDRGGMATFHGPGQWVVFVVDLLERLTGDRRGVRRAVEGLLEIACEVSREYDARAEVREGPQTGVWIGENKVASVGVKIEQGVLLHGICVNGFQMPLSFTGIRPCGLEPQVAYLLEDPVVSGAQVADRSVKFDRLGDRLRQQALRTFWQVT